ncbi:MAG TPA: SHOCT domain-containing protein [Ferruginibacter sp.]|jgi:hypothetical protein|nr:SHOCT domain-containing protein [Ferruginibacter sp.]
MNKIVTTSDKIAEKKRELYQDLEKIKSLLDKKVISEDEYNRQKESLLKRLDQLSLEEKDLPNQQQAPLQKRKRSKLWIWAIALFLLSSIFYFLYNKQIIFPDKNDTVSSDTTGTSTSTIEDEDNTGEKFIGSWKLISTIPADTHPNDDPTDTLICDLSRYGNTKTAFVFNWGFEDVICFMKDNNTLLSQNGAMLFKYDEIKKQLKLSYNNSGENKVEIYTKIQ